MLFRTNIFGDVVQHANRNKEILKKNDFHIL